MKQIIYLLLIIGPLVCFSYYFPDRNPVHSIASVMDSVNTTTTNSIQSRYTGKETLGQKIKIEIQEQIILQKDKWREAFPKIILFLFVFGLLYVAIASLTDMLLAFGMYAVFLFISVMELIYFLVLDGDTWFCFPARVGWLWTVINFLLFTGTLFLQYKSFALFTSGITGKGIIPSFPIGIISGVAGTGLWLLQFHSYPDNNTLMYIALGTIILGQLVQLIVNISRLGFLYGILLSVLYIICFTALVIAMWHLLKILLILFLVYCLFLGFISSIGSKSSSSSTGTTLSEGSLGIARTCRYFDNDQLCDYYGTPGSRSDCGMLSEGKCQHGVKVK